MSVELRPFFSYFGGKWRVAKKYPRPVMGRIIEPFAGSAGYSLRYSDLDVILYDTDPYVFGVWDYLIKVPVAEVLSLPLEVGHVRDLQVCQEAKWLIGFWINKATTSPKLTPSSWMRQGLRPKSFWGEEVRDRIASQVGKIRHWKVFNRSYDQSEDVESTWFVDPPYYGDCGRLYRHKIQDYEMLANWCQSRKGLTIVCERHGADWLPFEPFCIIKTVEGRRGKSQSQEVVWLSSKESK